MHIPHRKALFVYLFKRTTRVPSGEEMVIRGGPDLCWERYMCTPVHVCRCAGAQVQVLLRLLLLCLKDTVSW